MTRTTWTKIGAPYNGTEPLRKRVQSAIDGLEWLAPPVELPFCPGEGIKNLIKVLRLPKVSHVAHSSDLAPYGFLGVRCQYTDGTAEVYAVDEGSSTVVVRSDFHPNELAAAPVQESGINRLT